MGSRNVVRANKPFLPSSRLLWMRLLLNDRVKVMFPCWWMSGPIGVGLCRQFAPTFSQAAEQLSGQCRFAKLDSEAYPALSGELGIRSIPSLLLFRNGQEIARQSGDLPLMQLLSWLKQHGVHN